MIQLRHKRLEQRGDTIIEVLIAIAVVSAVLGSVMALANRTAQNARQAEEHQTALKHASSQIELLAKYLKQPGSVQPVAESFCMTESPLAVVAYASDPPAECRVSGGSYDYAQKLSYDLANKVYTSSVTWDGPTGSTDQVSLTYRAEYSAGSFDEEVLVTTPSPTPPDPPGPGGPPTPCTSNSDIAFVLDHSESMTLIWHGSTTRFQVLTSLMGPFITDANVGAGNMGAIIPFSQYAWVSQGVTGDASALTSASDDTTGDSFKKFTHYIDAMQRAKDELAANGRPGSPDVIVLVSDGYPDDAGPGTAVPPTLDIAANEAVIYPWLSSNIISDGIVVHTVGINSSIGSNPILSNIASMTGGEYEPVMSPSDLDSALDIIADEIACT